MTISRFHPTIELARGVHDIQRALRDQNPALLDGTATRLDGFERRLSNTVNELVAESNRLRLIRRSWCQATFSQSVVHNTNTIPSVGAQYNRPAWTVSGTTITPNVHGYYRCTVYGVTSNLPAGGRLIVGTRLNNALFFGSADSGSGGGSPEQAPSSRILPMNGTTDYVNVFLYQFHPGGSTITMGGAVTLELVDLFENV